LDRFHVQPCFLELARPSIAEGVRLLAQQEVRRIRALPLLLLAAGHVKADIPAAMRAAAHELEDQFGSIELHQTRHLSHHDSIVQLSAKRFHEAVADLEAATGSRVTPDDTLLLLVSRGSRDQAATDEMGEFAKCRAEQTAVACVRTCFLAMAEPSLDATLNEIGDSPWETIVVQPHLLFYGQLLTQLSERVRWAASRWPNKQWLVTRHLGPDPLLIDCIVHIVQAAWTAG
jgi:sirohydrochlorin cobaltochelatase